MQSTCTSPFLEAESTYLENMQDISQLKRSSNLSNIDTVKHENSTKCERESDKHNDEAGGVQLSFISYFCSNFLPLFCFLVTVSLYCREITVYIGRCKVQQNF